MGANRARRPHARKCPITAVYDSNRPRAQKLALELGEESCQTLTRVTDLADVAFTVVPDDEATKRLFST